MRQTWLGQNRSGCVHTRGGIQTSDVVVVQNVGGFGEGFHTPPLANGKLPREAGIEGIDGWSTNGVTTHEQRTLISSRGAAVPIQLAVAGHIEDVATLRRVSKREPESVYDSRHSLR